MRISDWSSDVCSSDLLADDGEFMILRAGQAQFGRIHDGRQRIPESGHRLAGIAQHGQTSDGDVERIVETVVAVGEEDEIGRASGRERVGQYGYIVVVAGT